MAGRLIAKNVRVEVDMQTTAPVNITAITKASPPVVTAAGHGLANGDVIYLQDVEGMAELDQQAVRVASVTASTFELDEVDSTSYGAFVSGKLVKVSTWSTMAKAQRVTSGSTSTERLDGTVLLDTDKQYEMGTSDSPELTFGGLSDMNSVAVKRVRKASETSGTVTCRITFVGQSAVRVLRFKPSTPTESIEVSQLVTSEFTGTQVKAIKYYGSEA